MGLGGQFLLVGGMSGGQWRYLLGGLGWMNVFYGWVMVGGDMFWVGEGVWTFFMGDGGGWRYIVGG